MANHPNRSKSIRYDNPNDVMDYALKGTYRHEHPENVASGSVEQHGEYRVTWARGKGYLVYFGTGTPRQLNIQKDETGYWLKTKDYDATPEFARTRFVPDAGELERLGAL